MSLVFFTKGTNRNRLVIMISKTGAKKLQMLANSAYTSSCSDLNLILSSSFKTKQLLSERVMNQDSGLIHQPPTQELLYLP